MTVETRTSSLNNPLQRTYSGTVCHCIYYIYFISHKNAAYA